MAGGSHIEHRAAGVYMGSRACSPSCREVCLPVFSRKCAGYSCYLLTFEKFISISICPTTEARSSYLLGNIVRLNLAAVYLLSVVWETFHETLDEEPREAAVAPVPSGMSIQWDNLVCA